MKKHQRYETLVYIAIVGILIIAPVVSLSIRSEGEGQGSFNWTDVYHVWTFYIPFLITFLIHNYLLAPQLIYHKKKVRYLLLTAAVLAIFQIVQCANKPPHDFQGPRPPVELSDSSIHAPQQSTPQQDQVGRPHRPHHGPPLFFGQHDVLAFLVMIMLIGMNLGVKLYFKSEQESRQLEAIRRESLQQQLAYLTHQISPHFFMNTLNNIHALVDIDPEKARKTVLELSRIMRYMLYEGDKGNVPLQKEIYFLDNYVTLMKLRFTDKVTVTTKWPDQYGDWQVPPLLFTTFIENAFKHGVSYRHPSFIDIQIQPTDEKLTFVCRNSQTDNNPEVPGGVGLNNAKKRLQLIYGDKHHLDIDDGAEVFSVRLTIRK